MSEMQHVGLFGKHWRIGIILGSGRFENCLHWQWIGFVFEFHWLGEMGWIGLACGGSIWQVGLTSVASYFVFTGL